MGNVKDKYSPQRRDPLGNGGQVIKLCQLVLFTQFDRDPAIFQDYEGE
jgi:hypothetical protein